MVGPAFAQYCLPPPAIGTQQPLPSTPGTGTFYSNFVEPYENTATGGLSSSPYAFPLSAIGGGNAAGDLNSTYFPFYYSLYNLGGWTWANGVEYPPNCAIEIVIVGAYPNARYFSITDNDAHYTAAQHLADKDIDPAVSGMTNPFVVGSGGSSQPYSGTQYYVVPISLGTVPDVTNGCQIRPFEEDNLLDATQRHYSMDWNTNLDTGSGVDVAPGVNSYLDAHVVDTPNHENPTQGGSIVIRSYLAPPVASTSCSGSWGSSLNCPPPTITAPFVPYLMIRDSSTGCPYYTSYLTTVNPLINQPMVYQGGPLNCSDYPEGCGAIISTSADLTLCPAGDTCTGGYWLDATQQTQHTLSNSLTPQAAYADGHPLSTPTPTYPNNVAWTRSPQWNGTPGPDDSYIGGSLSVADLDNLGNGHACGGGTGYGCVMRMRFKLPAHTPDTPCQDTPPASAGCYLKSNAALRYWSLTLWQQQPPNFPSDYYNADPDGIAPNGDGTKAVSIISLADSAFTVTDGYVTLLVAIGGTNLPPALQQTSASMGIQAGAQPETVGGYYSAWVVDGYNVISLHPFNGTTFDDEVPLMMTLRNTLPAGTFDCSGAAVPFSTAEYTPNGGMMGPYVPQVDFVDANSLPTPPTLPTAASCGEIPNLLPSGNGPLSLNSSGQCVTCVDWPGQSWAEDPNPVSPALGCCGTAAGSPVIDFVATQFPVPVDASTTLYPGSLQDCYEAYASQTTPCSQIVYQYPQGTGTASGTLLPPVPITIVGSGFGYLPNLPQLMTSCGGGVSCASNYLEVSDCAAGNTCPLPDAYAWDTSGGAACQVYIADWTDTSISIIANLPTGVTDLYSGATVSPLSDFSPLTISPAAGASFACPVAASDTLRITVINPQNPTAGGTLNIIPWSVSPAGTPLN